MHWQGAAATDRGGLGEQASIEPAGEGDRRRENGWRGAGDVVGASRAMRPRHLREGRRGNVVRIVKELVRCGVRSSGAAQSLACRRQAILLQATVGFFRDGRRDRTALDEPSHRLVQLAGWSVAAERARKFGEAHSPACAEVAKHHDRELSHDG